MSRRTSGYASDLTDAQWDLIKTLLPMPHWGPGRPMHLDLRCVLNAMLYIVRSGCQWANLPNEYPHPNSVYYHYRKWCHDGTWEEINGVLCEQVRLAAGREASPSAAIIDSQSVKTTSVGGACGYDAGKCINGRKRHILVDTMGNLLKVVVHPANLSDAEGAKWLLTELPLHFWDCLVHLWADSGYRGAFKEWVSGRLDIELDITLRSDHKKGFVVIPTRWVVERTFAWFGHYRRLSKDYEYYPEHTEGMVYLASIHRFLRLLAPAT